MDEWTGSWVMPNINLLEPIEFGPVAIVPVTDPRAQALCATHPKLGEYVGKFRNAFQVPLSPALLIHRTDAPASFYTVEAVASIRDLLSACVIPYCIALTVKYGNHHRITFSDFFTYHPWHLGSDYDGIRIDTPAALGYHVVEEFLGQSSPEIHVATLSPSDIDRPLFDALVKRWRRRYSGHSVRWDDRKLFRSLNMASEASRLPGAADTTLYDVGRLIVLWISALEILFHPKDGDVGMLTVLNELEKIEFVSDFCKSRRYKVCENRKCSKFKRRPLASWICWRLYLVRNDFIHGKPVSWRSLRIGKTTLTLSYYAAGIYRLALTRALALSFPEPTEDLHLKVYMKRYFKRSDALEFQEMIERAIRTAVH